MQVEVAAGTKASLFSCLSNVVAAVSPVAAPAAADDFIVVPVASAAPAEVPAAVPATSTIMLPNAVAAALAPALAVTAASLTALIDDGSCCCFWEQNSGNKRFIGILQCERRVFGAFCAVHRNISSEECIHFIYTYPGTFPGFAQLCTESWDTWIQVVNFQCLREFSFS